MGIINNGSINNGIINNRYYQQWVLSTMGIINSGYYPKQTTWKLETAESLPFSIYPNVESSYT